jgi:hypothetical protein
MAYPTGINWRIQGAGLRPIAETTDVQWHPLGTRGIAHDVTYGAAEFVYLAGVADTAPGDVVCYNLKTGATVRAVTGGATSFGPAAVAMSANIAGQYGWYAVFGAVPVNAATVAADAPLFITATAGRIDDAVVVSNLITGLISRAATVSDFATCQLAYPSVESLGGSSGANSGDVSLGAFGSTPAAAGASLSGQVLTLQPASATHPGGIAAATFTALTGINKITLTPAAAVGDTIEVEGQVSNILGVAAAVAHEVMIRSLSVTSNEGDITIGIGANPGTLIEAFSPATGVNEAWITTTAAGHFRFIITNAAAEDNLVEASATNALETKLKLTFA